MIHACGFRAARIRPILTLVLVTVLLVLSWVGLEVYFAYSARPNPTVDYGEIMMEYAQEHQPVGDDMWPVLLDAIRLHEGMLSGIVQDGDPQYYAVSVRYQVLLMYDQFHAMIKKNKSNIYYSYSNGEAGLAELEADMSHATLAASLWEESGIVAKLSELANGRRMIRPMDLGGEPLLDTTLAETASFIRSIGVGMQYRMQSSYTSRNWQAYVESFDTLMGLGRLATHQLFDIDYITGMRLRTGAISQLLSDLQENKIPTNVLQDLMRVHEKQSGLGPPSNSVVGDLNIALDAVQRVHDKRGRIVLTSLGDIHAGAWDISGHPLVNMRAVIYPRKHTTEAWFREYYSLASKVLDATPAEKELIDMSRYDEMENEMLFTDRMPIQESYLGNTSALELYANENRVLESALPILIALHFYQDSNGVFPVQLHAMVPDYIEELPIDPFNLSQDTFGYVMLEKLDEHGRGYILYSVGYDLTDNGGTPPGEGHRDALSYYGESTDYIINHAESSN